MSQREGGQTALQLYKRLVLAGLVQIQQSPLVTLTPAGKHGILVAARAPLRLGQRLGLGQVARRFLLHCSGTQVV